ncbi:MAG: UbiD family decarboxylase [Desulfurococcales archaeon]|nr:UbiD family decarboxylase [Desulfurococcales archaeon]
MGYRTVSTFLEKTGFEDLRGKPLPREYAPARLLKEKEGGAPVLFTVEGTSIDAVGNLVDTRSKLHTALGVENDVDAYKAIIRALSPHEFKVDGTPGGYRECDRGLLCLPAVKFYERDGGLYLTASLFISCYDSVCNASIHRVMVTGAHEARVRIVPRHLYSLYKEATAKGEDLPVTIVLGVHPAYLLLSAFSPPRGVFELGIAAKLLSDRLVESPLHGHPMPMAGAVIEGYLTRKMGDEGPFADILLLYDKVRKQPVLKVEKVYISREEPAHVILSGGMEHIMLMGFPREVAIWEAVSRVVPKVHKVRLTPGGGGWLHAVISISKNHPGDGKNAILAAFSAHPSLKHVIVVDEDIDVEDPKMVEWAIATRFQADRDLVVVREARGSTLDPSGRDGYVSKMGIDATIKGDPEKYRMARIPGEG